MPYSFSVYGISTGLLKFGDNFVDRIISALKDTDAKKIEDGDIIIFAESPLATTEGRIVKLNEIVPSQKAIEYGRKYKMDERLAEIVLRESDEIVGGVCGYLLARRGNLYLPNAGVDESNAPSGYVTLLPKDADESAKRLRDEIREKTGKDTAVLVIDSRTHAMRMGVCGVAIGVSGILPVTDERGKKDLFGHELHVTRRAVADNLASSAELLMGESNEGVPAVLVRGYDFIKSEDAKIEFIAPEDDLFLGLLKK
ncbi:MAG: coenzyme F420-0:L-glutamate ligase [Methanocorpusculum sp.]|nr:coenzyme F420-0:L-glutamate ligase [Methanocorpusculum sp.]